MASSGKSFDVRFARADDEALANEAPPMWRDKAAQKHFARDARLELVAGGLLARMLAERGIRAPQFATNPFGKPHLHSTTTTNNYNSQTHFSLSHSGEIVMCVLADCPVGCDVERLVLEPGRDRAFYEEWTRREAGLKALGCGFGGGTPYDAPPHPAARNIPAPDGYVAAILILYDS